MINAFCFYFGDASWSRHARYFFTAWQKQEEVKIHSWNEPSQVTISPDVSACNSASTTDPGIGLGPIEFMTSVVGSKRIAFVVWETTIMPQEKVSILRSMDVVWTPSSWGRQLLINNGLDTDKVGVVPEGVDVERFKPAASPERTSRPFRFLCIGKWEPRKGIEDLITAFCDEFLSEEPVELVLHAWNPYLPGFNLEDNVRDLVRGNAPSIIASYPLARDAMVHLYNSCDAFVLPTRAEAWGLPITEAMACGLPVIVTEYSGPVDYLNQDIAYLVPVEKLISVRDPYFFPEGDALGQWAQPDLQCLRKLMRSVFENPAEARDKGRLARAEVCNRWTWDHAASTARRLLSS